MRSSSIVLALAGGALLGSAYALETMWPAAFVAVAALILSLEHADGGLHAALHGGAFGWAGYVGGFYWLQPALVLFWDGRAALSWAVWIAWGCWVSIRFAAIAWGYGALRRRGIGILGSAVLPWVTVEWLYPAVFPFYLANPLVKQALIAQGAALGGPLLVSAWVCAVGAVVAQGVLWLRRNRPPRMTDLAIVAVASIALVAYGFVSRRAVTEEMANAPSIRVGVVQANVDVIEKRAERVLSHRRYRLESEALAQRGPLDLIVWPETSYLHALPRSLPLSGAVVRGDLDVPLLFGGVRREGERRFNSAMLVDADGIIRSAYDKRFLIPFAEYVPLGDLFPAWAEAAPTLSRFDAGERPTVLNLGDWRIATPICYETIRPGYVRELVRSGSPHLLISLTNDGWFGDSPEPRIHLELARFRAIEHRRYLVRATNTGISAIVDPLGRVVARTEVFEAASIAGNVRLLEAHTVYERFGSWPGPVSALACLFLVVARRASRDRRDAEA